MNIQKWQTHPIQVDAIRIPYDDFFAEEAAKWADPAGEIVKDGFEHVIGVKVRMTSADPKSEFIPIGYWLVKTASGLHKVHPDDMERSYQKVEATE